MNNIEPSPENVLDRIIRETESTLKKKSFNNPQISTEIPAKKGTEPSYRQEVTQIKSQIGDLEVIRQTLGLSRRKMCQLLLVDPSAWTRWGRSPTSAPPHIYRALQWYMLLQEKNSIPLHRLFLNQPVTSVPSRTEEKAGTGTEPIFLQRWFVFSLICWNCLLTALVVWQLLR